jgi:hypothetical protein
MTRRLEKRIEREMDVTGRIGRAPASSALELIRARERGERAEQGGGEGGGEFGYYEDGGEGEYDEGEYGGGSDAHFAPQDDRELEAREGGGVRGEGRRRQEEGNIHLDMEEGVEEDDYHYDEGREDAGVDGGVRGGGGRDGRDGGRDGGRRYSEEDME